jgi:hypothetical protein
MGEVRERGVVKTPNVLKPVWIAKGGGQGIIPDQAGVVGRGRAMGIDAIQLGGNAVEIADDDQG